MPWVSLQRKIEVFVLFEICVDALYYILHLWYHLSVHSQNCGTTGLIWCETQDTWIFMPKFMIVSETTTTGKLFRYQCILASG